MSSSLARSTLAPGGPARATRQQLDELDALLQRMLDLPVHPGDEAEAPRAVAPPPPPNETPAPRPRLEPERLAPPRRPATLPPPRAYPPSYMVVETNAPTLGPTEVPDADNFGEFPVPGGRHDLVADDGEPALLPGETGEEEWVPFRSTWQPSAQTWAPLARTWEQANGRPVPTPPEPSRQAPVAPPTPFVPAGPIVVTQPPGGEASWPAGLPTARPRMAAPSPLAPVIAPALAPASPGGPLEWFNTAFDLSLVLLGPPGRWFRGAAGRNVLGAVGVLSLLAAVAVAVADGFDWTW